MIDAAAVEPAITAPGALRDAGIPLRHQEAGSNVAKRRCSGPAAYPPGGGAHEQAPLMATHAPGNAGADVPGLI